MLSDYQIADLCKGESPMIVPFIETLIRPQDSRLISYGLSSAGYDIRLADHDIRRFKGETDVKCIVDPKRPSFSHLETPQIFADGGGSKFFYLPPHSYALGVSVEKFDIPDDVTAIALGKSTYARSGILVNITPLESGWVGYLTIEIANSSPNTVKIYLNEGIVQLMFFQHERPDLGYPDRSGKYQNQANQVVLGTV